MNHASISIRTFNDIDICEYPDSGKINILPNIEVYQTEDKVNYFKGENKVSEKWSADIIKKQPE